jgi:plastocyanin
MRPGRWLVTAVTVGLAVTLAGCSNAPQPEGVVPAQDAEGRYIISMTSDLTFDPAVAEVPEGATVVWRNDSNGTVHDVAGYRGDPIEQDVEDFSSFDAPPDGLGRAIPPGGEFTHGFSESGDWTIWCHTHHEEGMKGVIRVG